MGIRGSGICYRGPQGPKGDKGDVGSAGQTGAQGPQGVAGVGVAGPKGDTGPTGPKGDTGSQGVQGQPGVAGSAGPKGDAGSQGPQGVVGPAGATGATGPAGPASVTAGASIRTLGVAFQPHATKPVFASYSVKTQVTNPLVAGSSTATVTLLSDAANPPTTERARDEATSSVGLAVSIALTTSNTAPLAYLVPAGHFVKLVSTIAGTGTATIVSQTEVVLG